MTRLSARALPAALLTSIALLLGPLVPVGTAAASAAPAHRAAASLTMRVPAVSESGVRTTLLVKARSLPTGTRAVLQRRSGKTWLTKKSARLPSTGVVRFRVLPPLGGSDYRVSAGGLTSRVGHTLARPSVTPATAVQGQPVLVTGRLAGRGARPVLVQVRAKRWRTVARGRSSAAGAVRLAMTATASGTVRVLAPRYTRRPSVQSGAARLVVAKQSAAFELADQSYRGEAVTVPASFGPARAGRPVQLQAKVGSGWRTVAAATQSRTGAATFSVGATQAGLFTYRVLAPAWRGIPAIASISRRIRIDEIPVAVSGDARPLSEDEAAALVSWDPDAGTLVYAPLPDSLADVKVGDVLTVPPTTAAPTGLLRRVTAIDTAGSTTTLTTADAALPDIVDTVPGDVGAFAVMPAGPIQVTDVADGIDVLSDVPAPAPAGRMMGLASVTGPRLNLAIDSEFAWKVPLADDDGAPEAGVSIRTVGSISAAPTADFDIGTTWYGKLTSYQLGAGLDWNNDVVNTVTLSGDIAKKQAEKEFDLARIERQFVTWIGPVPVYIDVVGKLVAEFKVTGQVGVKFRTTYVGRAVNGVKNKPGSLDPTFYTSSAKESHKFLSIFAGGKAEAFAGGELQVMLYGLIGPYLKVGLVGEASFAVDSQQLFTCTLRAGPGGEIGVTTSDGLKKLTGFTWTPFKHEFWIGNAKIDYSCPYFRDPVISTSSLPGGAVGEDYSAHFEVADGRKGTWSVASGSPPRGLTLNASTGLLLGKPEVGGRKVFQVRFTDDKGNSVIKSFTIQVAGGGDGGAPGLGDGDVLVFGDSDNGVERNNMVAVLEELGFNVDVSDRVPEDISQYQSIWEIEAYSGFDQEESDRVVDYINAGGSVYMTGERPCCEELNDSVESVLNRVLYDEDVQVGDAGDSPSRSFVVNPDAVDGLAHNPNLLEYFHPDAPGRLQSAALTGVSSRNVFVRGDAGDVAAAAWRDNDMISRQGRVVVIMDIDYLKRPHAEYSQVIENVATFLNRG